MIRLIDIAVDLGTHVLFQNANALIQRGDRIGLVGRNGAGKTTLLSILVGMRTSSRGSVAYEKGITIGLLSQDLTLNPSLTLWQTARQAFTHILQLRADIEATEGELTRRTDYDSESYMALVQRLADLHEEHDRVGGDQMDGRIDLVLRGLGFTMSDFDRLISEFSGGWQMRAELGRLLLQQPDCLLLDEPTNHLDIDSVRWLETFLLSYPGAIVLVSHDRTFLDKATNRTIELTRSRVHDEALPYSKYEAMRTARMEQQKAAAEAQHKEVERIGRFISRFKAKASLASRVQSRIKMLQKMDQIEVDDSTGPGIRFSFPPSPRSGRTVVECEGLVKSFGGLEVLKGISMAVERSQAIAFVGRNGEGKTTLSRILAGIEPPTDGTVTIGHNTRIGYYAQRQAEQLDSNHTVLEVMERASPPEMRPRLRSLLGCFLFSGDDVNKRVAVLSGGEKSRLALARLLLQPVNLLILDEPTNHLDMFAKEVLRQALLDFDGAMIIVSHDRDFLEGLTDKVVHVGNGAIKEFIGDIGEYLLATEDSFLTGSIKQEKRKNSGRTEVSVKNDNTNGKADTTKSAKPNPRKIAELEARISEVESEIARLGQRLSTEPLHQTPEVLKDVQSKYTASCTMLEELIQQWETLIES